MRRTIWFVLALAVFIIAVLRLATGIYIDYLWFGQLGYESVFTTALISYWALRLGVWLFFAAFLYINLARTRRALMEMPNLVLRQMLMNTRFGNLLSAKRLKMVYLTVSLILPWLVTGGIADRWMTVRMYFSGSATGILEPIFARDASFYLFALPVYELLYQYLLVMLIFTALLCATIYYVMQPPQQLGLRNLFLTRGQVHLSVLLAAGFLVRALGYRLQMYSLLLSPRGATFGPGYTDMHAQLPAYWALLILAVLAAMAMLYNIRAKNARIITGSVIVLLVLSIVLGGLLPGAVQAFLVEPNEYVREEPYLAHNIAFTQTAYGLDKIERRTFPLTATLTYEGLLSNEGTINNIRLWDWRPLLLTFNALQGLRPYYRFNDVDTDRYLVEGEYRQLMLSARELVSQDLPSRTWINERLMYTHGYGLVASPVNEVTGQGMPRLAIRDLPVRSDLDLQVTVPQIYYGELTTSYIFTGARTDEFDYPMGDANAFTRYEGDGGVPLGGLLRRLLFAMRFADYRILISGELSASSQVHFYRNIDQRIRKVAPFLRFDQDPYLVAADGRLFWIIDGYTTSSLYPYAEPTGEFNYIRNSVKTVVDAYNGSVDFYIYDAADPLINAYSAIFPALFKPAEELPVYLRKHIRYPEYLFLIQSQMYATYHMANTQVFYNKEDRWQWPREKYEGNTVVMDPYYTIIRLPQEDAPEFVLMLPYTPVTRENMVAWMAGRSDGDNYGELVIYEFPRGELIYGPNQIEARIDQDSRISEQLSLWDQRGSSVIRGNLLVLPINGSILYVEPIYLRAENSPLPELARVVVAYGERVVMERTLEEALAAVFGLKPVTPPDPGQPSQPGEPAEPGDGLYELITRAAELYSAAEEAVKNGNWAEYGRLQQELGSVLSRLQEISRNETQ
jgi:uncharacterized protein